MSEVKNALDVTELESPEVVVDSEEGEETPWCTAEAPVYH